VSKEVCDLGCITSSFFTLKTRGVWGRALISKESNEQRKNGTSATFLLVIKIVYLCNGIVPVFAADHFVFGTNSFLILQKNIDVLEYRISKL
jgi:hypothetical protein